MKNLLILFSFVLTSFGCIANKKETDKKSHNPIRCVKIPLSFFEKEEEDVEIIPMQEKDKIL